MGTRPSVRAARPALVAAATAALIASGAGTAVALTAAPSGSTSGGGSAPVGDLLAGSYSADFGRLSVEEPKGRVKNKVAPALPGTVAVGQRVAADVGTWKPEPDSYAYQWFADGEEIAGATGERYTPRAADKGATLVVQVTASATRRKPGTAVSDGVVVRAGTLRTVTKPDLKGKPKVGSTLRVTDGAWSPAATTVTYQWYRDGKKVAGATDRTLVLKRADIGSRFQAVVTATRAGYSKASAASPKSDKVTKN